MIRRPSLTPAGAHRGERSSKYRSASSPKVDAVETPRRVSRLAKAARALSASRLPIIGTVFVAYRFRRLIGSRPTYARSSIEFPLTRQCPRPALIGEGPATAEGR